jgi:hypothetical protein
MKNFFLLIWKWLKRLLFVQDVIYKKETEAFLELGQSLNKNGSIRNPRKNKYLRCYSGKTRKGTRYFSHAS